MADEHEGVTIGRVASVRGGRGAVAAGGAITIEKVGAFPMSVAKPYIDLRPAQDQIVVAPLPGSEPLLVTGALTVFFRSSFALRLFQGERHAIRELRRRKLHARKPRRRGRFGR